jgi:hypothetical protein
MLRRNIWVRFVKLKEQRQAELLIVVSKKLQQPTAEIDIIDHPREAWGPD